MRQPVVIVPTVELGSAIHIWTGLIGNRLVCLMPPRVLNSPSGLRQARIAVARLAETADIEPVWPWESDAIAEG